MHDNVNVNRSHLSFRGQALSLARKLWLYMT